MEDNGVDVNSLIAPAKDNHVDVNSLIAPSVQKKSPDQTTSSSSTSPVSQPTTPSVQNGENSSAYKSLLESALPVKEKDNSLSEQDRKSKWGSNAYRADGTLKDNGFLGVLKMKDGSGNDASEISVGVEMDGKETEIPTLVPTLSKDEVDYLLSGKQPTKQIIDKAASFARDRMAKGLSPFYSSSEQQTGKITLSPETLAAGIQQPVSTSVQKPIGTPDEKNQIEQANKQRFNSAYNTIEAQLKLQAGQLESLSKDQTDNLRAQYRKNYPNIDGSVFDNAFNAAKDNVISNYKAKAHADNYNSDLTDFKVAQTKTDPTYETKSDVEKAKDFDNSVINKVAQNNLTPTEKNLYDLIQQREQLIKKPVPVKDKQAELISLSKQIINLRDTPDLYSTSTGELIGKDAMTPEQQQQENTINQKAQNYVQTYKGNLGHALAQSQLQLEQLDREINSPSGYKVEGSPIQGNPTYGDLAGSGVGGVADSNSPEILKAQQLSKERDNAFLEREALKKAYLLNQSSDHRNGDGFFNSVLTNAVEGLPGGTTLKSNISSLNYARQIWDASKTYRLPTTSGMEAATEPTAREQIGAGTGQIVKTLPKFLAAAALTDGVGEISGLSDLVAPLIEGNSPFLDKIVGHTVKGIEESVKFGAATGDFPGGAGFYAGQTAFSKFDLPFQPTGFWGGAVKTLVNYAVKQGVGGGAAGMTGAGAASSLTQSLTQDKSFQEALDDHFGKTLDQKGRAVITNLATGMIIGIPSFGHEWSTIRSRALETAATLKEKGMDADAKDIITTVQKGDDQVKMDDKKPSITTNEPAAEPVVLKPEEKTRLNQLETKQAESGLGTDEKTEYVGLRKKEQESIASLKSKTDETAGQNTDVGGGKNEKVDSGTSDNKETTPTTETKPAGENENADTKTAVIPPETTHVAAHGDTKNDKADKISGRNDEPLSKDGEKQAAQTGQEFKADWDKRNVPTDQRIILTSPLKRGEQTGNIAAKESGGAVKTDPKLTAWDIKDFGGLTNEEFAPIKKWFSENPDATKYEPDNKNAPYYGKETGESVSDLGKRMEDVNNDRLNNYPPDAKIITHGENRQMLDAIDKNGGKYDKNALKLFADSERPGDIQLSKNNDKEIAIGFAPYRSNNVNTLEDDAAVRNSPEYKLHQQILTDAADKLGIKILSNNDTWGGYVDSETGKPVQEVSNIIRINATPEQAELLAAVLGKAAPEMQDGVLVGRHDDNGSGVEYTIKTGNFDNSQKALDYLKDNDIQHFTIDKKSGDIFILDTDNSNSKNIAKFTEQLNENGIKTEQSFSRTEARIIRSGEYNGILEKQRVQARPEEGGVLNALIEESRRRYEEIKSNQDVGNGGGGGKKVGLSHDSMQQNSPALGVDAPERGEGTTPEQQMQRGKELLANGANPETLMADYKAGKIPIDDAVAIAAAHQAVLTKAADKAVDGFGIGSKEDKAAAQKLEQWQKETKPLATTLHKGFVGLQGETDLDTGSFSALRKAFKDSSGRDADAKESAKLKELADKVAAGEKKLQDAYDEITEIKNNNAIEQEANEKRIAELEKKTVPGKKYTVGAKKLADQIRSLKTKPFTFTDKDGNEIEFKQNSIVPYNDIIEGIAKAVEAGGKLADKVKEVLDGYSDEAWYKNLDKEDREKLAQQLTDHIAPKGKEEEADIHTRFLNKNKKDLSFTPKEVKAIWDYAKENYLDKGKTPQDMVRGVATDLNLTQRQVLEATALPKSQRTVSNDYYVQQRNRNAAIKSAKDYVEKAGLTWRKNPVDKAMHSVGKYFDAVRTAVTIGHGAVAPFTHVGLALFNPLKAKQSLSFIFNTYRSSYGLAAKADGLTQFAQRVSNFMADPEYAPWLRSGLDVDATKKDNDYAPSSDMLGRISKLGDRGFFELKPYRLELAKADWNRVPEIIKSDPVAAAETRRQIATRVNHATGTISEKGEAGAVASLGKLPGKLIFAPKLVSSQVARLITDPLYHAKLLAKMATGSSTPVERAALKIYSINTGAQMAGLIAALGVNAGLLALTGSKQKINLTHPSEPDFMSFKGMGLKANATGGVAPMAHFLTKTVGDVLASQKQVRGDREGKVDKDLMKEVRGKASPGMGILFDFAYGRDYDYNVMPFHDDKPGKDKFTGQPLHKLTIAEYAIKHITPIPVQEMAKPSYDALHDFVTGMKRNGASSKDIYAILKGVALGAFSGTTGLRIGKDDTDKKKK